MRIFTLSNICNESKEEPNFCIPYESGHHTDDWHGVQLQAFSWHCGGISLITFWFWFHIYLFWYLPPETIQFLVSPIFCLGQSAWFCPTRFKSEFLYCIFSSLVHSNILGMGWNGSKFYKWSKVWLVGGWFFFVHHFSNFKVPFPKTSITLKGPWVGAKILALRSDFLLKTKTLSLTR